jgi:hypothetical protein
MILNR